MRSRNDPKTRLKRLRWLLGLLFLGLALPAAMLIRQGFAQIEIAEFRRQQLIAEDLVRLIDDRLTAAIATENARPVTDFDYAITSTSGAGNVVQLSPLSSLAAASSFPGTIGYFQVDTSGQLSTPLLPDSGRDTLPAPERMSKTAVESELTNVLEANRLVDAQGVSAFSYAEPRIAESAERSRQGNESREQELLQAELQAATERAFTRASMESQQAQQGQQEGRISSFRGQAAFDRLASSSPAAPAAAAAEDDEITVTGARVRQLQGPGVQISAFASDVEPLRFSLLETGHLVLFRNAWRDGERYVQGLLVDPDAFVDDAFGRVFAGAPLAPGTAMTVATAEHTLQSLSIGYGSRLLTPDATPLFQARLSPPLAGIEVAFLSGVLGRGAGFSLLTWTAIALFGVLVAGFAAMYRFGAQQLELAQQQQNFVSAVSHELKTPLTSIRMYGEMLKSGWADDQKKQLYYDYIFDEGERLSRLIDNVLQLARLNRSGPAIAIKPVGVQELFDILRSKLSTQAERAGFTLAFDIDRNAADATIPVDIDALSQVFINLVDNAIKFSAGADRREILVSARCRDRERIALTVRDFGPGIPPAAMKRLFELFYRPDNELTRTTAGTGIGLALVRQLVTAMSGRVDVRNCEPGAEFRIELPVAG